MTADRQKIKSLERQCKLSLIQEKKKTSATAPSGIAPKWLFTWSFSDLLRLSNFIESGQSWFHQEFWAVLRGCRSLLEIVFVGQREVFVCLGFGHFILFVYLFPWPRSS